jgi:DnaK suppressor protein
MNRETREHYRQRLFALRDRIVGGANHLVESIREDTATNENLSSVPLHLADVAPEGIDADVQVLETERGLLEEITAALNRIGDGSFGKCVSCSRDIGKQRLDALPYAPQCIDCAKAATDAGS